jgi:hypothetical protein
MAVLTLDISKSVDGFVAGPIRRWRNRWGRAANGCTSGLFPSLAFASNMGCRAGRPASTTIWWRRRWPTLGATVMGRRMFSGGEGPLGSR